MRHAAPASRRVRGAKGGARVFAATPALPLESVRPEAPPQLEQTAALVRAIRRAYASPTAYGGLERFTVTDIHDFARRLVEQGVLVQQDGLR